MATVLHETLTHLAETLRLLGRGEYSPTDDKLIRSVLNSIRHAARHAAEEFANQQEFAKHLEDVESQCAKALDPDCDEGEFHSIYCHSIPYDVYDALSMSK